MISKGNKKGQYEQKSKLTEINENERDSQIGLEKIEKGKEEESQFILEQSRRIVKRITTRGTKKQGKSILPEC